MEYDISNTDSFAHQGIVILNVFIAIVLAALVGFERESNNKPAGLRTNMIIAAVAVLLVSLGRGLAHEFSTIEGVRIDPIRIIEAIIVGVSFIGAGTIIKARENNDVYNLTTAATLLFSAGIGVAVALKQYLLDVGVTGIALFINFGVKWLEIKYQNRKK